MKTRIRTVDYSEQKFSASVQPIYLLAGGIGLQGEYFVTNKISAGVGGVLIPNHKMENTDNTLVKNYNYEHNEVFGMSTIMITGDLTENGFYVSPVLGFQKTAVSKVTDLEYGGTLDSAFGRFTGGYQWVGSSFRIAAGAGISMIADSDIIVKDKYGNEVLRTKSSNLSGVAIDFHIGMLF
jgi:hypothetical protein